MTYREWKEMAKTCTHRKTAEGRTSKASSRGKTKVDCERTGKSCKMGGCPMKEGK
jgi:hypothetical protein